ncbi:MAG: cation transporter [Candidatus Dormibacteraeota bacterium]|uniref:Cation transporter n=1 Tax=Candidatus Dormiibacter inghamiae TaxID=3127013 RepID=A0A934NCU2_9BACT|nr:cation transporter [Candidatus Dormibacteraeota bacterium]MBJ7604877.1 cation transporter [Candidatus Dormibacteraeota bacterium]
MSDHHHGQTEVIGGRLRLALGLTLVILLVEAAAGWLAHSLALLADAGHILTDVVALGLAWFAVEQAKRPADARRTYGYHRVGILAAMVNGAGLILIVAFVAVEAVRRFASPEPVQGGLVITAALLAIAVNAFIAVGLRETGGNLNVRAAMLHVLGDIGASVGVILAGVIILLTGWYYADPLISLGIAALIAWAALQIVRDTGHVLLEGTPSGVDLGSVEATILEADGVASVHDLHVWSLDAQQLALSCHVVVQESLLTADAEHLVRRLEQQLCDRFEIGHTTVQIEACHPCDPALEHSVGQHNHPHAVAPSPRVKGSELRHEHQP